jgi:predicted phosphohydrolase
MKAHLSKKIALLQCSCDFVFYACFISYCKSRVAPSSFVLKEMEEKVEIQILSDVHTEFLLRNKRSGLDMDDVIDSLIQPKAKYLALLGDIGCPAIQESFVLYQEFLSRLEGKFEHIFVIAGNHEYYCPTESKMPMRVIKERIRKYCERKQYLTFLDRNSYLIGNVRIIGATLWSDLDIDPIVEEDLVEHITDFSTIYLLEDANAIHASVSSACRNIRPDDMRQMFQEDLAYIIDQVELAAKQNEKVIILTHHPPSFQGTSPEEYCDDKGSSKSSRFASAFASDLEHLLFTESFQKSVVCWAFGHTHHSSDQMINGIRLVSNQVGYRHKKEQCECSTACIVTANSL